MEYVFGFRGSRVTGSKVIYRGGSVEATCGGGLKFFDVICDVTRSSENASCAKSIYPLLTLLCVFAVSITAFAVGTVV